MNAITITVWLLVGFVSNDYHHAAAPTPAYFPTAAACETVKKATADVATDSSLRCVQTQVVIIK